MYKYKRLLLFAACLLLVTGILTNAGTSRNQAGAAIPPRVEVTVTKEGLSSAVAKDYSNVILQWESNSSYRLQKVTGYNSSGTPVWSADLTYQTATGISKYEDSAVRDYRNHVYRVGTGTGGDPWLEIRAFPPNESAHSNYNKNTDTCKGCHRTHYAVHEKLLSHSVIYELCISCHDGSGSKYDVLKGMVRVGPMLDDTVDSPAGAFKEGVTSYHNVFLEEVADFVAPGDLMSGTGARRSLTCTDCHSAHVVRGVTSHFRLLKTKNDGGLVDAYAVYNNGSSGEYKTNYIRNMNDFCSGCHEYYNYNNHDLFSSIEVFHREDYDDEATYRHPTGIDISAWLDERVPEGIGLPLEKYGSARNISCITCHFAHGSTVRGWQISPEQYVDKIDELGNPVYLTVEQLEESTNKDWSTLADEGFSQENGIITEVPVGYHPFRTTGLTTSTMLKREDNMGVCFQCHKLY